MNKLINGLMVSCSLGVSMLLAAPAWSVAASDAQGSPAPPAKPAASMTLDELDEIIVQGRRLEQRLAESEARFYKRYNMLNSKDDLDVNCGFLWEDTRIGSAYTAQRRSCVPAYYLKAVAMDAPIPALRPDLPCSNESYMREGDALHFGFAESSFSTMQPAHDSFSIINCVAASSMQRISNRPNLVYLDRRAEFVANLMRVLNSDPQLKGMAGELDALALEGREAKLRSAEAGRLRRAEQKCAPLTSPRTGRFCRD